MQTHFTNTIPESQHNAKETNITAEPPTRQSNLDQTHQKGWSVINVVGWDDTQ